MSNRTRPIGVLILVIIYVILAILRFGAILLVMETEASGVH